MEPQWQSVTWLLEVIEKVSILGYRKENKVNIYTIIFTYVVIYDWLKFINDANIETCYLALNCVIIWLAENNYFMVFWKKKKKSAKIFSTYISRPLYTMKRYVSAEFAICTKTHVSEIIRSFNIYMRLHEEQTIPFLLFMSLVHCANDRTPLSVHWAGGTLC